MKNPNVKWNAIKHNNKKSAQKQRFKEKIQVKEQFLDFYRDIAFEACKTLEELKYQWDSLDSGELKKFYTQEKNRRGF